MRTKYLPNHYNLHSTKSAQTQRNPQKRYLDVRVIREMAPISSFFKLLFRMLALLFKIAFGMMLAALLISFLLQILEFHALTVASSLRREQFRLLVRSFLLKCIRRDSRRSFIEYQLQKNQADAATDHWAALCLATKGPQSYCESRYFWSLFGYY